MNRKVHEVTGYVPPDAGFMLCLECHFTWHPEEVPCDCDPVFLGSESQSAETCDHCGEEIETTVIG